MKQVLLKRIGRTLLSLMAATILLGTSLAATGSPVSVGTAADLVTALTDAGASGDATTIYLSANIDIGSSTIAIPSNVTLDLSGYMLSTTNGLITVYGTVVNGSLYISGGTLLRMSGSSITASISLSSGGVVRVPVVLSLENLDISSGETIDYITYDGGGSDSTAYVQLPATGTIYVKTQSNFTSPMGVTAVMTSAGNYFRLGTKNTDTLSLSYYLSYGGLSGATLTSANPASYTASDSAILLTNPTKDGYVFSGWICEALGITVPTDSMVIPSGTTGDLTFIAVWSEDMSGGMSGGGGSSGSSSSSSSSTDTTDAEDTQDAAAATDAATTATSSRRTKVASSSTKVTFSSDMNTVLPTLETLQTKSSFPWGIVIGSLAGLGVIIYVAVKFAERKKQ